MARNAKIGFGLYVVVMVICVGLLLPDRIAWLLAIFGVLSGIPLFSTLTKKS